MSDLPVNYADAVLDGDVNDKRRYRIINNPDGTVSFEDVTEYTIVGSNFGAADINQTNAKVNEINTSLKWRKIATSSGSYDLTQYNELMVKIYEATMGNHTILLLSDMLTSSLVYFRSGDYANSSNSSLAEIQLSTSQIGNLVVYVGGTLKSNATFELYGR